MIVLQSFPYVSLNVFWDSCEPATFFNPLLPPVIQSVVLAHVIANTLQIITVVPSNET